MPQGVGYDEGSREGQALAGRWRNWMGKPENRSAVVQFGLQLMQPVGIGQNALGHAAQAFGSGMEAKDRSLAAQHEGQQAALKSDLATRRTAAAETRANASAKRAGRSGGLSLSSLISNQRRDESDFVDWVNEQYLTPDEANEALANPEERANLVERYQSVRQLAREATGGGTGSLGTATGAAQTPQYREGQTATNPQTGERLVFRNGQWVPM